MYEKYKELHAAVWPEVSKMLKCWNERRTRAEAHTKWSLHMSS